MIEERRQHTKSSPDVRPWYDFYLSAKIQPSRDWRAPLRTIATVMNPAVMARKLIRVLMAPPQETACETPTACIRSRYKAQEML
jgi:hypothetical protein